MSVTLIVAICIVIAAVLVVVLLAAQRMGGRPGEEALYGRELDASSPMARGPAPQRARLMMLIVAFMLVAGGVAGFFSAFFSASGAHH